VYSLVFRPKAAPAELSSAEPAESKTTHASTSMATTSPAWKRPGEAIPRALTFCSNPPSKRYGATTMI
jgi:hypothetical protein